MARQPVATCRIPIAHCCCCANCFRWASMLQKTRARGCYLLHNQQARDQPLIVLILLRLSLEKALPVSALPGNRSQLATKL